MTYIIKYRRKDSIANNMACLMDIDYLEIIEGETNISLVKIGDLLNED